MARASRHVVAANNICATQDYCPPNQQQAASKEHIILPDLQIQNCFVSRSIMPRNIIDDWWAQGKDEQVTGKRSRKQKKFDDESSTEQPDVKKAKSKSAVAKAPNKKSTVNKTTSKSSKTNKSRASKTNTDLDDLEASTVSHVPNLPPIEDSNPSDTPFSAIDSALDPSACLHPNKCVATNPSTETIVTNHPNDVCATAPPQTGIAKQSTPMEPKVKKVDAKEWCQEIKDHPDVKKNWVVLSEDGFSVICNICPGSKPHKMKRCFELGNWYAHEKLPSHESYRSSKVLNEQRVAAGVEKYDYLCICS
jgi:hypothetical protein